MSSATMKNFTCNTSNPALTMGVLALCLSTTTPVEGFAPHRTFNAMPTQIGLETAAERAPKYHTNPEHQALNTFSSSNNNAGISVAPRGTATALQASLVDRFFRVARGNMNSAISRFEDPEKVMNQALVDMQNDITKVRQTYAEVTAGQRRLASKKAQHESAADDWYRRAQLAVKRGNEGLAKEALARREQALQLARGVEEQMNAQAATLDTLYEGMKTLEGKILEANSRKSQLAARAKTAKSTSQVNDMLSGLSGKTSMDAFRRMEDKVVALETAAEVSAEFLNEALLLPSEVGNSNTGNKKTGLELEFRRLEASDSVELELELLKASLLPPAASSSVERTTTTTTTTASTKEPLKIPINMN